MTLEEIKRARAAITQGQWKSGLNDEFVIAQVSPECPSLIADTRVKIGMPAEQRDLEERKCNTKFIAKAPEYIDYLLEQVEQMRQIIDYWSKETEWTNVPVEYQIKRAKDYLARLEGR